MATPIPRNQARFELAEIAALTGGTLVGASRALVGVVTDSRAVDGGELFVALVGERHDAHRFVSELAGRAGAFLVSDAAALPPGASGVVVSDTLVALGRIARHHAERWREADGRRRLVAITGSAGKTSTKELVVAALRGTGAEPFATVGNLNNLVGVPMTLLTLGGPQGAEETAGRFAVIEMGTNRPGEIRALGAMAQPDVAVVTLVAAAHTEGIGTEEEVFVEKTSLLGALRVGGEAIVNGEDARLRNVRGAIRYGWGENCDVRVLAWEALEARTHARWSVRGHLVEAQLQLVGEAAALNGAGALAVAMVLGVDLEAAAAGMERLAPVSGRMQPRQSAAGVLVLDDTYNANPSSTLRALRTSKTMADARGGRLFAVLGELKELGALSREKHREVREVAEPLARCVFVGTEMGAVGAAVADADEALAALAATAELRGGDVVLVKGSRSMALEQVVATLVGEVAS